MSRTKWMAGTFFAMVFALLSWGCTSTSADGAPKFNAVTGAHPTGWMTAHWAEYLKTPGQCSTCHGSTTDPAAAGGIAKISCFTCHANGVNHPTGWASPAQHGRQGAQLMPNPADPTAMAGFAHCAKCHGDNYAGGLASSCKTCHTKAPHPDKPWVAGNASVPNHSLTNEGNAAECAKCHLNGANSTRVPSTPAPPTTAPGCYNNSLCHDRNLSPAGLSNLGR